MIEPSRWLPDRPDLPDEVVRRLAIDFARFTTEPLPSPLEPYLLETYGVDVAGRHAGRAIRNPWGKGSGQLSMRVNQVAEDIDGGLGFVVLKTVIAEDATGERSMGAWATTEAKMAPEPIVGRSGRAGWTLTWKGRGWGGTLDEYLAFVGEATRQGLAAGVPVVPSAKYHLPEGEEAWRGGEYVYTTRSLESAIPEGVPFTIEKDFSPTLAGSGRSTERRTILRWLGEVPALIRSSAKGPCRVGLKVFNALFDDDFQLEMLETIAASADRPDFVVYANRLFDPARMVAFGGPDLSDRNLRVLARLRDRSKRFPIELSATGDLATGRLALLYAVLGCTSFQIHTGFQLPAEAYPRKVGPKVARALHALTFDPKEGLVAWLLHAGKRLGCAPTLLEVVAAAAPLACSDLHAALA